MIRIFDLCAFSYAIFADLIGPLALFKVSATNGKVCVMRAGVLYREPRQLKPWGEPLHLKAFWTIKRASAPVTGGSVLLTGPLVPLTGGSVPLSGSFNCLIVGLGSGVFNCQGFGVSLRIYYPSPRKVCVKTSSGHFPPYIMRSLGLQLIVFRRRQCPKHKKNVPDVTEKVTDLVVFWGSSMCFNMCMRKNF